LISQDNITNKKELLSSRLNTINNTFTRDNDSSDDCMRLSSHRESYN